MTGRKKKALSCFYIVLITAMLAVIGHRMHQLIFHPNIIGPDDTPRVIKDKGSDCPSLDEMLSEEFTTDSIKMDTSLDVDKKNPAVQIKEKEKNNVLKIEKDQQENKTNGIRIILRYDDRDTLLRQAKLYGLTLNYKSNVPYYFVLNSGGERLYFNNRRIFEKFLRDIGGEEALKKARKEISVRLVSGKRIEVTGYF